MQKVEGNVTFHTAMSFSSVMQVINNLTMLTVILTGAALIRERERGTVEHLLVMPVVPAEIMLSKILANGIVILAAAQLSLLLVVQWWLQVPIAGSTLLFLGGSCVYVFTVAALGILLGTVAATMGQFGLLAIPVLLVMMRSRSRRASTPAKSSRRRASAPRAPTHPMRAARSEYDAPSVRAADASDIGPQRPARYGQNDREIALTRKNALFAGCEQGAANWAAVASLIETCKLNGVDPEAYLEDVLTKLINLWPASRIDELMPWAWLRAQNSTERIAA